MHFRLHLPGRLCSLTAASSENCNEPHKFTAVSDVNCIMVYALISRMSAPFWSLLFEGIRFFLMSSDA